MNDLTEIRNSLKTKADKNFKWQILFALFALLYMNIHALGFGLSLIAEIHHFFIIILLFNATIVWVDFLIADWIRMLYHVRQAIKYSFKKETMNLNTITQNNVWLEKNSSLIITRKSMLKSIFFNIKKIYFVWGLIETQESYQIILIDFSKNNQLVILNISKEELDQYSEKNTIIKWINKIEKKRRLVSYPIMKQLYSSTIFCFKY
ncbi:hypothetical protein GHU05_03880 [Fructobacillus tropaeoli]|uniref:hypothetical protein n=1 Tax=Fructobacillus tropaeoli TaxID=709323 RepID=UPI00145617DE|nr:hypothetical protein [Fructobacillus tropaeoli]NLS38071.1 hypothetical protein [Fructobacillus tropaeoli]